MVGAWGDKHGAACQYSPSSSNLPSAMPEVTSLCLIALHGFLPRIYLAVFWPLGTFLSSCYNCLVENLFKWEMGIVCSVMWEEHLSWLGEQHLQPFVIMQTGNLCVGLGIYCILARKIFLLGPCGRVWMTACDCKAGIIGYRRCWLAKLTWVYRFSVYIYLSGEFSTQIGWKHFPGPPTICFFPNVFCASVVHCSVGIINVAGECFKSPKWGFATLVWWKNSYWNWVILTFTKHGLTLWTLLI